MTRRRALAITGGSLALIVVFAVGLLLTIGTKVPARTQGGGSEGGSESAGVAESSTASEDRAENEPTEVGADGTDPSCGLSGNGTENVLSDAYEGAATPSAALDDFAGGLRTNVDRMVVRQPGVVKSSRALRAAVAEGRLGSLRGASSRRLDQLLVDGVNLSEVELYDQQQAVLGALPGLRRAAPSIKDRDAVIVVGAAEVRLIKGPRGWGVTTFSIPFYPGYCPPDDQDVPAP